MRDLEDDAGRSHVRDLGAPGKVSNEAVSPGTVRVASAWNRSGPFIPYRKHPNYSSFSFLVVMPAATSSFLLLIAMPLLLVAMSLVPDTPCMPYMPTLGWCQGVCLGRQSVLAVPVRRRVWE